MTDSVTSKSLGDHAALHFERRKDLAASGTFHGFSASQLWSHVMLQKFLKGLSHAPLTEASEQLKNGNESKKLKRKTVLAEQIVEDLHAKGHNRDFFLSAGKIAFLKFCERTGSTKISSALLERRWESGHPLSLEDFKALM